MAYPASACATSSRQSRAARVWACSMTRLAYSKKGPAWISGDLRGGEAGVSAGGGNGSLGLLRGGATWQCRAMASKTQVRSAVVTACVNCHRSSSTVGAVCVKRGSNHGGIDKTPLTWFQMLRRVGLATCRRAPATGGTMCVGRLLLTKDGACCSLSTTHACNRLNTWKCHVATTTLQCAWKWKEASLKGVWELQAGAHAQFIGGRRLSPLGCLRFPCLPCVRPNAQKPGFGGASQEALLHCEAMALSTPWAQHRPGFPRCPIPWPSQCPPQPWTPLILVDRAQRQP